jgi:HAD superfamily hydrolase (TIGR01484 family)
MQLPSLVFFDLDGTLAASKQPIEPGMAELLAALLARAKVAVISGGKLEQLAKQAADRLPADAMRGSLYLLPTSGAALYAWQDGAWRQLYEERMTDDELARVAAAAREGAASTGLIDFDTPAAGERVELRGSQVTLSALGQEAGVEAKRAWDPTHEKRDALRGAIAPLLPGYDVKVGGSTSIDITKEGVNKAYGIRQTSERLGIPVASMLYVGDELAAGGNDEVAKETGIPTHPVASPADTENLIRELLGRS